ncbi:hypothetical protein [Haloechinothrix halophila]|uniref:Uncharacterized protein n=1 Tax=Haloechinothrix halophila YIM 93223 TaxID=592678 RepID=W9DLW0_9PSEU|nr:hypothetical protein [Haloechinothrix halophila]ETA66369.1 hypothetical protein AmyhaDRAFT_0123 [Haloechinothrix halophila YIM 93223]
MSDVVTEADEAARTAAAEVELLEEQIRAGDESITPEQLDRARGFARFQALRRETARRKAEKARQAARKEQAEVLLAELAETGEGSVRHSQRQVREAVIAAQEAVEHLVVVAGQHRKLVRDVTGRVKVLNDALPDAAMKPSRDGFRVGNLAVQETDAADAIFAALAPTLERRRELDVNLQCPNGWLIQPDYVINRGRRFQP